MSITVIAIPVAENIHVNLVNEFAKDLCLCVCVFSFNGSIRLVQFSI